MKEIFAEYISEMLFVFSQNMKMIHLVSIWRVHPNMYTQNCDKIELPYLCKCHFRHHSKHDLFALGRIGILSMIGQPRLQRCRRLTGRIFASSPVQAGRIRMIRVHHIEHKTRYRSAADLHHFGFDVLKLSGLGPRHFLRCGLRLAEAEPVG